MKLRRKGVIFDLDGTLVDTLEDIAASMNRALALNGYPELPAEDYSEKVGSGIRRLAFLSLPKEERREEIADSIAADAIRFYSEKPLAFSRVYPGIMELMSSLKSRKIKTAVLTNKPDPVAQKVIEGLFASNTFSIVRGEIFESPRKPDPACVWEILVDFGLTPANVVFAGDSEIDMETASASGCFALGVSWGYRSREILLKAGARHIIEKPEELLDLL
jgi:phosphoglycolate phosphatase